jgi:hypothetical protein
LPRPPNRTFVRLRARTLTGIKEAPFPGFIEPCLATPGQSKWPAAPMAIGTTGLTLNRIALVSKAKTKTITTAASPRKRADDRGQKRTS